MRAMLTKVSWYCGLVILSAVVYWFPIPVFKEAYFLALEGYASSLVLWYFTRWVFKFDLRRVARQKINHSSQRDKVLLIVVVVLGAVALFCEWLEVAGFCIFAAIFVTQDILWAKCDRDAFRMNQFGKAS
ncbi:membrane protein of unknown function [Pararobbsia alpina]|uniref:hypothetical protein n=1 Tax=Pararobbsia alpina TaxID=621374 RepID=UPI0039A56570